MGGEVGVVLTGDSSGISSPMFATNNRFRPPLEPGRVVLEPGRPPPLEPGRLPLELPVLGST